MSSSTQNKRNRLALRELVLFALFGAMMFCSKLAMQFLPNIHSIGMFTVLFTVVFRKKALIPLYVYVFLEGILAGFSVWWMPYLYVWTILWGVTMLLPRDMSKKTARVAYPLVCCLHGLAFGVLYAPAQAILFGLNWQQMLAWIAAGFTFDALHAAGNLLLGLLIVPLASLLRGLLPGDGSAG